MIYKIYIPEINYNNDRLYKKSILDLINYFLEIRRTGRTSNRIIYL